MSAEDELLRRIAERLDDEAPAITVDEIRERRRVQSIGFAEVERRDAGGRRTRIVLAIAAATILAGGVAAILASRSPAPTLQTGGVPTLGGVPAPTRPVAPAPTAPRTAPDASPATTLSAPTSTTPPADVDLDGDPAAVLAAIDADRVSRLRTLTGFTATARTTTETRDVNGELTDSQPGLDSRTTMLADGSMWSELLDGGFTSYDASTGESRASIRMPTGEMYHQLIEGWTDNSTGASIMLGADPARLLTEYVMPGSFVIDEVTHEARPAWRIESVTGQPASSGGAVDDSSTQVGTIVIDQATGLIVASSEEWESRPGERTRRSSELLDLTIVDEMPDGFPGEFPDGVDIDRSGDPNGFRPLSLPEAAEWFGPGFVAPPELPTGSSVTVSETPWEIAPGQSAVSKSVDIRAREGFATLWTLSAYKDVVAAGTTPPDSRLVVDGNLCNDFDGDQACDQPNVVVRTLENPALADFAIWGESPGLTMWRDGLVVVVGGSPLINARELAETFVAW